jgi:pilus assembly protein Flp/PilA
MLRWLTGDKPKGDQMNASIRNFLAEEEGITALEYGILACLVAAALAVGFYPNLVKLYGTLMSAISTAVGNATASTPT